MGGVCRAQVIGACRMAARALRVRYVRIFVETILRSTHDARRMGGSFSARSSESVFVLKTPDALSDAVVQRVPGAFGREPIALAKGEGLADRLRSVDTGGCSEEDS
jgi:hypothetical protein